MKLPTMAAVKTRTNSEMSKMGMAPPLKPKSSSGSYKPSMKRPKAMRSSARSK